MITEIQESLFPSDVAEQLPLWSGWQDPEARLYKALVSRGAQLPNSVLWYHPQLVMSSYKVSGIACAQCLFVNLITAEKPGPKALLDSNKCKECGAELTCPVCFRPLEIGNPTEVDHDLLCTNPDCDVWIGIW